MPVYPSLAAVDADEAGGSQAEILPVNRELDTGVLGRCDQIVPPDVQLHSVPCLLGVAVFYVIDDNIALNLLNMDHLLPLIVYLYACLFFCQAYVAFLT